MRNVTILDMMNKSSEILILNPKEALGILDLRSLGYYKIMTGNPKNIMNLNQQRSYVINTII